MDSNKFQEEFFIKHDYYQLIAVLLQKGETVTIPLYGYCMRPFIENGDTATIKSIVAKDLKCGDIVVCKFESRFKIHRFLGFKTYLGQKHLVTKGDKCITKDGLVPFSLLLGKIIQVKKNNRIVNYESKKWNLINFLLGKLSPYISIAERIVMLLIRLPRKGASKVFKLVMGVNYRENVKKRKGFD